MRRFRSSIAVVAVVALTACGGTDTTEDEPTETPTSVVTTTEQAAYTDECGGAVEAAAAIGANEDTVEDLDAAIAVCGDLDELRAATDDYPDALDGVDVSTFVGNRCQYAEDEAVTGSAICAEATE